MNQHFLEEIDNWLAQPGPQQHVVVSSRVRYARNIDQVTFPPHASSAELQQACRLIVEILNRHPQLRDFQSFDLGELSSRERARMTESHLISPELEKAGLNRLVCVNVREQLVIMVNEEDHLRMYSLRPGFQLFPPFNEINRLDSILGEMLPYAFHEQFGFLAACPTNTGTGMRGSVMLHLPGLAMTQEINEVKEKIAKHGMVIRGFYGEHSEHLGDFHQISNETTLGKKEEDIIQLLIKIVERLIQREEQARNKIFAQKQSIVEDIVWRSFGNLRYGRRMSSKEAMQLLSRLRLGVDRRMFPGLTHAGLNRLIISVQPAHLQPPGDDLGDAEERDVVRADFLRKALKPYDDH